MLAASAHISIASTVKITINVLGIYSTFKVKRTQVKIKLNIDKTVTIYNIPPIIELHDICNLCVSIERMT